MDERQHLILRLDELGLVGASRRPEQNDDDYRGAVLIKGNKERCIHKTFNLRCDSESYECQKRQFFKLFFQANV